MKIKLEIWEYPITWDKSPKSTKTYDLENENQKLLLITDVLNIKDNELISLKTEE